MADLSDVKLTKCNLKGLLLSKIGGVSLNSLLSEYKSLYDEELSFKRLGFSSLHAFLKNIPDVATVESCEGQMRVFGTGSNVMNTTSRKAIKKHKQIVNGQNILKIATLESTTQNSKQPFNDSSNFYGIQKQNGKKDSIGKTNFRKIHIHGIPYSATKESLSNHLLYYNFKHLQLYRANKGLKYGSIMLPLVEAEKLFLDETVRNFNGSQLHFSYWGSSNAKSENSTQALDASSSSWSSESSSNPFSHFSVDRSTKIGRTKFAKEEACNAKDCFNSISTEAVSGQSKIIPLMNISYSRNTENGHKIIVNEEAFDEKEDRFDSVSAKVVFGRSKIKNCLNISDSRNTEIGHTKFTEEEAYNKKEVCFDSISAKDVSGQNRMNSLLNISVNQNTENGHTKIVEEKAFNEKEDSFHPISANVSSQSRTYTGTSCDMEKSHLDLNKTSQQVYIKNIPVDITIKTLFDHLRSYNYNAENIQIMRFYNYGSALFPEEEVEKLLNDQGVRVLGKSLLRFSYPSKPGRRQTFSFPAPMGINDVASDKDVFNTGSAVTNFVTEKNEQAPANFAVYIENLPFGIKLEDVLKTFDNYGVFQAKMICTEGCQTDSEQEVRPVCLLNFYHINDAIKLYRETDTLIVLDKPVRLDFTEILPEIKKCLNFDNLIITRIAKKKKRIVTESLVDNLTVSFDTMTNKRFVTEPIVEYAKPLMDQLPVSMSQHTLTLMYGDVFPDHKMHSKEEFE